jgi:hypothetical protein
MVGLFGGVSDRRSAVPADGIYPLAAPGKSARQKPVKNIPKNENISKKKSRAEALLKTVSILFPRISDLVLIDGDDAACARQDLPPKT